MKRIIKTWTARLGIMRELLHFFWRQKIWWLIPMIVVVLIGGLLVVVGQQTALTPFIYMLF